MWSIKKLVKLTLIKTRMIDSKQKYKDWLEI